MTTYGVGVLQDVKIGPPIVEYLERIDATLAPFDGHFIIHGGRPEMLEGTSPGTLIVIEFPDREAAEQWYASNAYQAILPLRAENSVSNIFLIDGVGCDHVATDVLR
ncbi:MAG TPA: DUF1330 domain-containing protein [Acidimicrobiales bacterium]|nr:DUF1330 domain-containing protein [Acidimicrobiales bacterium]